MQLASNSTGGGDERRIMLAQRSAVVCVLGLALTWVVAELVPAARVRDAAALNGFIDLGRPWVDSAANHLLAAINPVTSTVFIALLSTVALRRGRRRLALAMPLVLGLSVGTSELLKPLLAHSHDWVVATTYVTDASWPSGHSAAAMAMALCGVLATPRRLRPLVALAGGAFTVLVGFSLLTLAWHMPSDVIGGFLVAALWTSVAVIALLSAERRAAARQGTAGVAVDTADARRAGLPATRVALSLVCAAGAVLIGVVLLRPHEVADFASGHHALVLAAGAITALAALLTAGLTAGLRR